MPRYSGSIGIGDVLVTREGRKLISGAIRLGAWLRGKPATVNHVIVVHHVDAHGVLWGIEGRPGGVGWRDLSGPLGWPLTNANSLQPKTDVQRRQIAEVVAEMLGTPYDWEGIAEDTREALRFSWQLEEWADGQVPGHVVCSSLADYAYEKVGLPNPGGSGRTRHTTPGEWDEFMIRRQWERFRG